MTDWFMSNDWLFQVEEQWLLGEMLALAEEAHGPVPQSVIDQALGVPPSE